MNSNKSWQGRRNLPLARRTRWTEKNRGLASVSGPIISRKCPFCSGGGNETPIAVLPSARVTATRAAYIRGHHMIVPELASPVEHVGSIFMLPSNKYAEFIESVGEHLRVTERATGQAHLVGFNEGLLSENWISGRTLAHPHGHVLPESVRMFYARSKKAGVQAPLDRLGCVLAGAVSSGSGVDAHVSYAEMLDGPLRHSALRVSFDSWAQAASPRGQSRVNRLIARLQSAHERILAGTPSGAMRAAADALGVDLAAESAQVRAFAERNGIPVSGLLGWHTIMREEVGAPVFYLIPRAEPFRLVSSASGIAGRFKAGRLEEWAKDSRWAILEALGVLLRRDKQPNRGDTRDAAAHNRALERIRAAHGKVDGARVAGLGSLPSFIPE